MVYARLWPLVTPDITGSHIPWLWHTQATGPIHAFARPFGDYAPPYLYLLSLLSLASPALSEVAIVKLVAVTGTGLLTVAVHRLLQTIGTPEPWRLAVFTPFYQVLR